MCGLIGSVVAEYRSGADERLRQGLNALHHRGPDHGEYQSFPLAGREVLLGHTRLSIIDLSDDGNQPMSTADGRYTLVFNGEIYNYVELRDELRARGGVFSTSSDTEVLLRAWESWGESCLARLDGMFAFVVLDKRDATLTCVRDPFGIKPFFYTHRSDGFYFASEMPALLALLPSRPQPDMQRAYDYLVHGDYDSMERTFIEGVRHLLPGHKLVLDVPKGAIESINQWWRPKVEQTSRLSFNEAADAVREQFLLSIKRQLRSDVPLGAALSGGIDSSAVVCAIRHIEPGLPIHTFSYVASDAAISEESWVDLVNEKVGAIPHKVRATADDLARDIDDLVRAQGEPFGSTSIYAQYKVFKLARDSGITVTLDGQGADELLAGYSGYPGYRLLSLLSEGRLGAAFHFANRWSKWPGRSYRMMGLDLARALLPDSAYAGVRSLSGRHFLPDWLDADMMRASGVGFVEARLKATAPRGRKLIQHLGSTLQGRGLPSLLRHGDRNAMRFSIESRVPFLSTDLCDLLYSLPEEYLISADGETKSVFRAAMRGIVPDIILDRKDKIGFVTPERIWLAQLTPLIRRWLQEVDAIPFLRTNEVNRVFDLTMSGKLPFNWQAWRLINYVRWWHSLY